MWAFQENNLGILSTLGCIWLSCVHCAAYDLRSTLVLRRNLFEAGKSYHKKQLQLKRASNDVFSRPWDRYYIVLLLPPGPAAGPILWTFLYTEKSVQYLFNIIVITQIVCTFLLNGGMTKINQPAPRLCYCFHYTHLGPLRPLSRGQDFFCNLQGTWSLENLCTIL